MSHITDNWPLFIGYLCALAALVIGVLWFLRYLRDDAINDELREQEKDGARPGHMLDSIYDETTDDVNRIEAAQFQHKDNGK